MQDWSVMKSIEQPVLVFNLNGVCQGLRKLRRKRKIIEKSFRNNVLG